MEKNIFHTYLLFFALLISFFWGIQPIIHKLLLRKINPKTMLILNSTVYFFCIIWFTIYNYQEFKTDLKNMDLKSFLIIVFTAVITAFLANMIYFYILKNNDSYIVSALIYSSPVFTLIFAYLFLKEKITKYGLIGVIFIIIGILFIAKNTTENFIEYKE